MNTITTNFDNVETPLANINSDITLEEFMERDIKRRCR